MVIVEPAHPQSCQSEWSWIHDAEIAAVQFFACHDPKFPSESVTITLKNGQQLYFQTPEAVAFLKEELKHRL